MLRKGNKDHSDTSSEESSGDSSGGKKRGKAAVMCAGLVAWYRELPKTLLIPAGNAVRVAVWVAAMSTFAMVYDRSDLTAAGFDASTIIAYGVLFQIGPNFGTTISNCAFGLIGTMLAAFCFWVLYGFMPGGYHHCPPGGNGTLTLTTCPDGSLYGGGIQDNVDAWWIGTIVVSVVTLAAMFLNVNGSLRFFFLYNLMTWAMRFLNPYAGTEGISINFEIEFKGSAINCVILYALAACISILIVALPYPLGPKKALCMSQDKLKEAVEKFFEMNDDLFEYYHGNVDNMIILDIRRQLVDVKELMTEAGSFVSAAWYESCGWSSRYATTKKVIELMNQIITLIGPMFDIAHKEDFAESHVTMMAALEDRLQDVIKNLRDLVYRVQDGALDGTFDNKEKAGINEDIAELTKMRHELTKIAITATDQVCPGQTVSRETAGELAMCYVAGLTAREVCTQSATLIDMGGATACAEYKAAMKDVFAPASIKTNAKWAARVTLQLFICFVLGYKGTCSTETLPGTEPCFVNPYDANIVGTVVILMVVGGSLSMSSAKERIAAVVIAACTGQFSYVILGWCGTTHKAQSVVVIFFVVLIFMYVSFAGGPNAGIGSRLAAIATAWLLTACSNDNLTYKNYSGYFHSISGLFVGVAIMIVVDLMFGDTPPAKQARVKIIQAMEDYQDLCSNFFETQMTKAEVFAEVTKIETLISEASAKSKDAVTNPSLFEHPWRANYFDAVAKDFGKLCSLLRNLAEQADDEGDRSDVFDSLKTKDVVCQELSYELDIIIIIARLVLEEKVRLGPDAQYDKLLRTNSVRTDHASIDAMIDEMNAQGKVLRNTRARAGSDEEETFCWKYIIRRGVMVSTLSNFSDIIKSAKNHFVEGIGKA